MRISVIGTSGSGKTMFAEKLVQAAGMRHIDLDAINWQPNWTDLNSTDVEEFRRRVTAAVADEAWVCSGNYGKVMKIVLARATHLVWLDYPRWLVMARVLRRSFVRAWTGDELWPNTGNRESFSRWLDKGHPIRWAWDTHADRKKRFDALMSDPALAHLERIRVTEPRDAERLIQQLGAQLARATQ
jgi:adenylate kinase family enzyme